MEPSYPETGARPRDRRWPWILAAAVGGWLVGAYTGLPWRGAAGTEQPGESALSGGVEPGLVTRAGLAALKSTPGTDPDRRADTRGMIPGAPEADDAGPDPDPPTPQEFMDRFRTGDEDQRFTLMQDRSGQGTELPLAFYESAMRSDPSPRVRMAAFEAYLDAVSVRDPKGVEPALRAVANGSDEVLSREARRRLDSINTDEGQMEVSSETTNDAASSDE